MNEIRSHDYRIKNTFQFKEKCVTSQGISIYEQHSGLIIYEEKLVSLGLKPDRCPINHSRCLIIPLYSTVLLNFYKEVHD